MRGPDRTERSLSVGKQSVIGWWTRRRMLSGTRESLEVTVVKMPGYFGEAVKV